LSARKIVPIVHVRMNAEARAVISSFVIVDLFLGSEMNQHVSRLGPNAPCLPTGNRAATSRKSQPDAHAAKAQRSVRVRHTAISSH
jgi:hypothetical protein